MARAKHGGYLFKRNGSNNWWIKLRNGGKRIERSLATSDKLEAEARAAAMIGEHKAALLAARPRVELTWKHALEPGREHAAPDGGKIVATDRELIYIGGNGSILRQEPNGGRAAQTVIRNEKVGDSNWRFAEAFWNSDGSPKFGPRPTVPTKNGDDAILEVYLQNAKNGPVTGYDEREARAVWALFKTLTNGKPLKDCDRDDGRKLVAHFENEKLKSATIEKKIAWLNAAVNLAIKDGKLKLNPFAAIAPKRDDKLTRLPLNDADIKLVKRNLDDLGEFDQLLFRLLASTGMRIAEAFEIGQTFKEKVRVKVDGKWKLEERERVNNEMTERGVRYVIVGHKTSESLRRVPFPAAVLPYLPKKITGPLFKSDNVDPVDAASKRLNKFLDRIGIDDPAKVVHSLRHRAQDRLRAAGCLDPELRWAILGHEDETVAAGYGEGFPVPMLKKWIDKIGF